MHLLAPAKINLHLRIGPPRADGFHPLVSWMTTIGLFDRLTFFDNQTGHITMTCDQPGLACDDRNLVIKAAKVLRPTPDYSAVIHLQKKIPHGGGLGGGSSDAAFTLLGLNRLWNLQKSAVDLDEAAATLGSDINFFLHGPSSICSGRGEIVRPVDTPLLVKWVVLILPAISMPTPAVYRQFDDMKLGNDTDVINQPDWNQWAALSAQLLLNNLVNDLERPAFAIQPALGNLRHSIEQTLSRPVRMSGSGSSLFTLFDGKDQAQNAARIVTKQHNCRALAVELCPLSAAQFPSC